MSKKPNLSLLAALALAMALAGAACGGASSPAGGGGASGSDAGSPAPAKFKLFDAPAETSPPLSALADDLLGAPNEEAAAAAEAALRAAAVGDLRGIKVLALPVAGTGQSLLIIAFDEAAMSPDSSVSASDDPLPLVRSLVDSPALKAANVTRLVLVVRGADKRGPYVATLAVPMDLVLPLTTGKLTAELQAQLFWKLQRGGSP